MQDRLTSAVESEGAFAAAVECERTFAAGVQCVVVCVHEGERLVTVGALLRVALVHGVDHHCHLLAGAVQCLLTLLCQFPSCGGGGVGGMIKTIKTALDLIWCDTSRGDSSV